MQTLFRSLDAAQEDVNTVRSAGDAKLEELKSRVKAKMAEWKSNKDKLVAHIRSILNLNLEEDVEKLTNSLSSDFFSGKALYDVIRGKQDE